MKPDSVLKRARGGRFENIVEAIGNTPMVELPALSPKPEVRLWGKLEGRNPTGSIKDRIAKTMIEEAEAEGAIEPGQKVLEPTSGNTGISLGLVCLRKGYPLKAVMPDNVSPERSDRLRGYGAEIHYTPGEKGSNGAIEIARELADADPSYFMPFQYGSDANVRAHYETTGPEIIQELDEITAFVAGLGTGGTLMGVGRALKEHDPQIEIVAAEPKKGDHIQGLRSLADGFFPPIIDESLFDRKIYITLRESVEWTQRLLREEGIFAGESSGGIASAAVQVASELDEGNVVLVIPDDGWKYISAGIYEKSIDELDLDH